MSVTTTAVEVEIVGNASAQTFDFNYKILAQTDLVVRIKTNSTGVYGSPLILGTDYTVDFDSNVEDGSITLLLITPSAAQSVNILRQSDQTQQTVYKREGTFPAKTTETALDKLTLLVQELEAGIAPGVSLITQVAAANAAAASAAVSAAQAIATAATVVLFFQQGVFATLDAAANTQWFLAMVTDRRLIMIYLGSRSLGTNGWITVAGY